MNPRRQSRLDRSRSRRLTEDLNLEAGLEQAQLARYPHKGIRSHTQHCRANKGSRDRSGELDMVVLREDSAQSQHGTEGMAHLGD